jgi:hypothetical protein
LSISFIATASAQVAVTIKPGRNPQQPVDEDYTRKIREYTTAAHFNWVQLF